MTLTFAVPSESSLPLYPVEEPAAAGFVAGRPAAEAAWLAAAGFAGKPGQVVVLPGPDGRPAGAVLSNGR